MILGTACSTSFSSIFTPIDAKSRVSPTQTPLQASVLAEATETNASKTRPIARFRTMMAFLKEHVIHIEVVLQGDYRCCPQGHNHVVERHPPLSREAGPAPNAKHTSSPLWAIAGIIKKLIAFSLG